MLVRAAGRLPLWGGVLRQLRCAAPALALSPLARRPPARGLASDEVHAFFVKREGSAGFAEVIVPAGASVAALVKAAVAELRIDASPDAVTLALAAAAPGSPPLDSRLSLESAIAKGVLSPRADLLVTVHARSRASTREGAAEGLRMSRLWCTSTTATRPLSARVATRFW